MIPSRADVTLFLLAALKLLACNDSVSAFGRYKSFIRRKTGGMVRMASTKNDGDVTTSSSTKRVVWIRHGQTYMNELIGGGGISYGQPGFTDVFDDKSIHLYRDSPLSPTGVQQALNLKKRLKSDGSNTSDLPLHEVDLVAVSPLTRALQTVQLALLDHLEEYKVPIVGLPQATERVYLISDHGKSRAELQQQYEFVDFETHFDVADPWHFVPTQEQKTNYVEWRPHGQGQVYACLGEPQDVFDQRMSRLYHWLGTREERCIAVVCHAGVIEWMTSGEILANCEVLIKEFDELRPRNLWSVEQSALSGKADTF
ncbi:histidine phosphatase superfamily protein [Nitzschia inconspicua]|uniref:Histidine phosphatase superfamily protein n=1 Tax=Nitzschia inconspicua TaxID=303405 RepID=A0A9K3L7E7_9STRA|nr:histidine phosphatase superfamily protein [Nitzschia inconspicua]